MVGARTYAGEPSVARPRRDAHQHSGVFSHANSAGFRPRAAAALALGAVLALAALLALAAAPAGAQARAVLADEGGQLRCYLDGAPARGRLVRVGAATYYFDASGNAVRGSAARARGRWWVFGDDGRLLVGRRGLYRLAGGTYYVGRKGHPAKTGWWVSGSKLRYANAAGKLKTGGKKDGIKFGKRGYAVDDRASRLKITVMKKVAKCTKASWSRSKKLNACWRKCQSYGWSMRGEVNDVKNNGWVQRQALTTFDIGASECFGGVCMLAMFAYELGYKDIRVHVIPHYHATAFINGHAYNWAKPVPMGGCTKLKVLDWRNTNVKKKKVKGSPNAKASSKNGWVVKSGKRYYYKNGRKLKRTWLKLKRRKYYLYADGHAAVCASKVKKTWYVFSTKGVLKTGTGIHEVTVSGVRYRVTKGGKAKSGWSKDRTRYWLTTGALATGDCFVKGKLTAFAENGTYDAGRTKVLRAAYGDVRIGTDASALIAALGTPVKRTVESSCRAGYEDGTEIARSYRHLTLYTYRAAADNAPELFAELVMR